MKNNIILGLGIGIFCAAISFVMSGCSTVRRPEISTTESVDDISKVLSSDEIKKEQEVLSYFSKKDVTITDLDITRRQTNEDEKSDIVYAYITAEKEGAILEGEYIIESEFFDQGGWITMNIRCNTGGLFRPTETVVYDIMPYFEDNPFYEKPNSIEYTGFDMTTKNDDTHEYEGTLFFSAYYKGKYAEFVEKYALDLAFDEVKGNWRGNVYKLELLKANGKLLMEGGKYTLAIPDKDEVMPSYYEFVVDGAMVQMFYYDWEEKMEFVAGQGYVSGYTKTDMGTSKAYIKGGGVILDKYRPIVGFYYPCFKICADKIYLGYYNSWTGAEVEYDSELIKAEGENSAE